MFRRLSVLLSVLGFCLFTGAALAQTDVVGAFDFAVWDKTATRAESIIESAEASSPALETLRNTLAGFRSQALDLQDSHKERIATLQSQIDALGGAPAQGATEADDIAQRRVELTAQLADANAPSLAAQEAYQRADGLIGEVDKIIRNRLKVQLFTLGASPLNPARWGPAAADLGGFFADIGGEISEARNSAAQRVLMQQNLPVTLGFLIAGIVLMTRARKWLLIGLGWVPSHPVTGISEARQLLLSFSRIAVPMLGIWALDLSVKSTGLLNLRGGLILETIPWMGVAVFGAHWLGQTLFPSDETAPEFFDLDSTESRLGRNLTLLMGVCLALDLLLGRIAAQADFSNDAHVVLSFPIVLTAGLLLFRIGALLDPNRSDAIKIQGVDTPLRDRLYTLVTRGVMALGIIGPGLAAVGYFTASTSFVFSAILTLGLLGTMLLLHRLFSGLAHGLVGGGPQAMGGPVAPQSALTPVILGFVLLCLSAPLFALIWGARLSDLSEVWTLISSGFVVGNRRISVTDFLTFAVVFGAGYTITRVLQATLRGSVLPNTRLDSGGRNAILTGTGYLGIFLATVAAVTAAGLDLSSLAIVAGALSVGIGFGLQAIVSNFVSGIILLVERPIKEGDWIEVGAYSGYVRKISVRSTEIQTFDGATVIVPNADLISGTVTNRTHADMQGRVRIPIGVGYNSDPREVESVLLDIASAHKMIAVGTTPSVVFMGFGADSMDFEIRCILRDVNYVLSVKSEINYQIVERFRAAGIEIPYAQRDINLRNLGDLETTLKNAFGKSDK